MEAPLEEEKEGADGQEAEGEPEKKKKWGPPGLTEAITEALQPHAHTLEEQNLEDLVQSLQNTITKTGKKFMNDDRTKAQGSANEAGAVIEEFVDAALLALANVHYDKEWLGDIDWTNAFVAQAKYSFRGTKLVVRFLASNLKKYVDEAIFRHKEEQRIQKVFLEGLALSGLNESFHKRAQKNLDFAYNEAHMAAPYGETAALTPELGLVQDFVKFWMTQFAARSWDILEQGVEGAQEDRYSFMTNLFTFMCDPNRSILPQDVIGQLEAPPPENWPFLQEQAMASLKELEENPSKRQKFGGGGYSAKKSQGGGW